MRFFGSGRLRSFLLLFTDIIALFISILAVFYIYKQFGARYEMTIVLRTWPIFLLLVLFNTSGRLYCGNLFYPGLVIHPVEELRRLTLGIGGSFIIFTAILTMTRNYLDFSRIALGLSMLVSLLAIPLGRIFLRYLLWKTGLAYIPAVITGDSDLARRVFNRMRKDNYCILSVKASCCDRKISQDIPNLSGEELVDFSRQNGISYLIYCTENTSYHDTIDALFKKYLHVLVVNNITGFPVLWSYPVSFCRLFAFEISNRFMRKSVLFQKRIVEIFFSAIALCLILLPGVILALLVKLSSRGPVFYRAHRLGKNGKPIEVLKFRTMCENADRKLERILEENPELREEWAAGFKLENDPRITRIGKFLRSTSLDELPQFWNVLKGDMALIGPRPIVEDEVKYYGRDYAVFSSVKPGITGLWQVSGRSALSYSERVALDVFYINNWSIWMDYYIFFATINAVFLRRGAC